MTSNEYSLLFSVAINHSYYKDGICKQLHYTPSSFTRDLMARYHLLLQKTPIGFSFLTSGDIDVKDLLTTIQVVEEVTSFSFDVTSSDPDFKLLTDYPISELGIFSFYVPSEGDATTLERKFISGSTNTKSFTITIDFDAVIRFRESGNNPIYTIAFEARKTQWRYYVIINGSDQFEKIEIKGDANILFEGPTDMILQNGQKAYMFSSGSLLLPLKEESEYIFDLQCVDETSNSIPKTILTKLPTPGVNAIEKYIENGIEKMASPIYIYL